MRISDWSSDVCSSDLLALQIGKLRLQLVVALHLEIGDLCHGFHAPQCASPRRTTTLVRIGSLAAARSKAPLATSCATPSSSNRMRPGFTRATHNSGEPLPQPMRPPAGSDETGTSRSEERGVGKAGVRE